MEEMLRNQIPLEHINAYAKDQIPLMRWDGVQPIEEWKSQIREKLSELLGMHTFRECDPLFKIEYTEEMPDYTEYRFSFQSEEGYFPPCHLLIPAGTKGKRPLVVCLQGHTTGMHNSLGRPKYERDEERCFTHCQDFAMQAIRQGCCALTIEQRCFGECGGTPMPDCYRTAMNAILLGRSLVGERVWDVSRAVDLVLEHFPQIDAARLVILGNSGGGTATFYTGCLDERFCAVVPSCSFCGYYESILLNRHCTCNYIPGVARYFDMGDLAALIAPRIFIPVCGEQDPIFPIDGVKRVYGIAENLFRELGAANQCELCIGPGGHQFYPEPAWPALKRRLDLSETGV